MSTTLTILDYFYLGRNTWLKCNKDCACTLEELTQNVLDTVNVQEWAVISVKDAKINMGLRYRTEEEWDELIGPKAQHRMLQRSIDMHTSALAELITLQGGLE